MRLFAFYLLFSSSARSECLDSLQTFFVNGVFNSFKEADESRKQLQLFLSDLDLSSYGLSLEGREVELVHNETYFLLDLFEAYAQKQLETQLNFFRWMRNSEIWPSRWVQLYADLLEQANIAYRSSSPVINQLERLISEVIILEESKALVVAHSQGNFFANDAIDRIRHSIQIHWEWDQRKAQLISVASPASKVEGGGVHTTLTSDGIIKLIPFALPGNVQNRSPKPGLVDHKFVNHYLKGDGSGQQILDQIKQQAEVLGRVGKEEYRACKKWYGGSALSGDHAETCIENCKDEAEKSKEFFYCQYSCEAICTCGS